MHTDESSTARAARAHLDGVVVDGRPIRGEMVLAPGQTATLGAWQLSVRLPEPS